jgi:hypothetical protein
MAMPPNARASFCLKARILLRQLARTTHRRLRMRIDGLAAASRVAHPGIAGTLVAAPQGHRPSKSWLVARRGACKPFNWR